MTTSVGATVTCVFSRYECLGLWANLIDPEAIMAFYRRTIERDDQILVGYLNFHTLYLAMRDDSVRGFHERAHMVYVDGMPVIWWLKVLRQPARHSHRATLLDWLPLLLARARREGWRVYYLGSRPGVAEAMAEQFRARLPGLVIRTHHGYFDARHGSGENAAILADIDSFRPHVLLVGMGSPREQQWLLDNHSLLRVNVMQYCGATADYIAGAIPRPPRILGRLGLEGAFRLCSEPRRLWRRYLVEPWFLLGLAAMDLHRVYGPRHR
jgi:N-acetylglucosaminyldiphosphoundecaprenol N-acetyl-beta-D-mannosaminyltransferase